MRRIKHIQLAPYEVTYVDLREEKPRDHYKEIYVLDVECAEAASNLGIMLSDYIKEKFASRGYHVISVKAKERITSYVDLMDLYQRSMLSQEGTS